MEPPDFPPKVDILSEIYQPLPEVIDNVDWGGLDASKSTQQVIRDLSSALEQGSTPLANLFLSHGSYWKDTLAITSHLRTFKEREVIALALREQNQHRRIYEITITPGSAQVVVASETLKWLECFFTFKTTEPQASCGGRVMLLPQVSESGLVRWNIWTLSTWLSDFDLYPEDEQLLRAPFKPLPSSEEDHMTTDVLIIGGGNAGVILAARLKALGVDYLIIDQNENVGDNWTLRYDCLRFHVGKSFCELPYLPYPKDATNGLTREELAAQIKRFVDEFHLHVLHCTTVNATTFDNRSKSWTIKLLRNTVEKTVTCKHLVLATGVGFQGPYMPKLPGIEKYGGINIHSTSYKNASLLAEGGVKSVLVIGSANTAFDVMEDCYDAGLKTTMIQRSPTYVIPMSSLLHPNGLGVFDYVPAEVGDVITQAGPLAVGGPLLGLTHATLAAAEPERYANLAKAGFQVTDCTQSDLVQHLLERCGGHFVDIGTGVELLATKKVGIKSGVSPTSYTDNGLEFTDGSTLDADAIIWCTGFKGIDIRQGLPEILGEGAEVIKNKMEATWGVDAEGEVRGLWKRHEYVDNFWIFCGGAAQHRWYSKVVALQIKGMLEGILPDAYRDVPASNFQ
ncbi:FAD/NAD(P)-binding domain-containing protein [Mollisia scopiformis]|uniref:FAD/NAD(P)-binding domain-containing protein n=1 Tax=Mollisia scopiformis TaxID=149040 RepID=A0A194XFH5_MOLSC|nr:FAD/NAD(P)-binding domain-containing protein [Mollisia scopiformis]KUJ18522.1 FAD/NAD(P)-binding domain-containing protein [Mollisia scopiformis]